VPLLTTMAALLMLVAVRTGSPVAWMLTVLPVAAMPEGLTDGIELFNVASVPVTRYRYRGSKFPSPWLLPSHA
jgi:hypothetical protein